MAAGVHVAGEVPDVPTLLGRIKELENAKNRLEVELFEAKQRINDSTPTAPSTTISKKRLMKDYKMVNPMSGHDERGKDLNEHISYRISKLFKGSFDDEANRLMCIDDLLDCFGVVVHECRRISRKNKSKMFRKLSQRYEQIGKRIQRSLVNAFDFDLVKKNSEGTGTHSEILLVKCRETGVPYVIKKSMKAYILEHEDSVLFREELDFLISATSSPLFGGRPAPWTTELHWAFHDEEAVYLVLTFYPGGDLFTLLNKHEQFSEDYARFYIAQTVLALDSIHRMGYIHRDVNSENLLLDSRGNVRLADFGSCAKMDHRDNVDMSLCSGFTTTAVEYQSPELRHGGPGYPIITEACDWWSLGVTLYEMLVGETPFYCEMEGHIEVFKKINDFRSHLVFPEDLNISAEAQDLVLQLVTVPEERLDVDGIKAHPFFASINWDLLEQKKVRPPFKPELASATDTAFFDDEDGDDEHEPLSEPSALGRRRTVSSAGPLPSGSGLLFLAHTFTFVKPEGLILEEDEEEREEKKRKKGRTSIVIHKPEHVDVAGAPASPPCVPPNSENSAVTTVQFTSDIVWFDSARTGDIAMLKDLLENSKYVTIANRDQSDSTALHLSAQAGNTESVRFLLSMNAPIDLVDEEGNTAVALAAYWDKPDTTELLLESGADPNIHNLEEQTALDQADNADVIKVLQRYGALSNDSSESKSDATSATSGI